MVERKRARRSLATRLLFRLLLVLLVGGLLAQALLRRRREDREAALEWDVAQRWADQARLAAAARQASRPTGSATRPDEAAARSASPASAAAPATGLSARPAETGASPEAAAPSGAGRAVMAGGAATTNREKPADTTAPADREETDEPDDLQQIDGIGPVLERTLHGLGITTFRQIATLTPEEARRVGASFGRFQDRIEREQWVEQARQLYEAKHGKPVEPT